MPVKKFFGAIILLAMLALPLNVSAEKIDRVDRNYNFRGIRDVIVLDVTVSPGYNYGGAIVLGNLQDKFIQNSGKLRCNVITEAQARRDLSYQLGMDLNRMSYEQARHVIINNAYRIADAWVLATVDDWTNRSYMEPARTVWEQRKETRRYYDAWGNRREETHYVQVPVTYPPRRVDVSTIQMSLQLFDARSGQAIFSRRDMRDREDYQAQVGMFGRITNSFFEDIGSRIR